jgi:hypothetical protein
VTFKIDVRSNIKQVMAGISIDQKNVSKATVIALNRTAQQLRTEAGREVRKVYNLKLRAVRAASKILRAHRSMSFPRAEVHFFGRNIPLIEFEARAVKPWNVKGRKRNPGGGVSVRVKVGGARKLVRGAFISALTSNNLRGGGSAGIRAVFRREGRERYPIRNLRSISIPSAFAQRAVSDALLRFADNRFDKNLTDAVRFLTSKG